MARRTPERSGRLLRLASATALALAAVSSGAARAGASSLHLSGTVDDIYPGVMKEMRVVVDNRSGRAVRLRSLQAHPTNGMPGCAPENVVARARRANLLIEARQARSVTMMVGLRPSAPDTCQGGRFLLNLAATASVVPPRLTPGADKWEPTIAGTGAGSTGKAPLPDRPPPPGAAAKGGGSFQRADQNRPVLVSRARAETAPEPGITALWLEVLALFSVCLLVLWAIRRRHPQEAG